MENCSESLKGLTANHLDATYKCVNSYQIRFDEQQQ